MRLFKPAVPTIATVSPVDKAACEKALVGSSAAKSETDLRAAVVKEGKGKNELNRVLMMQKIKEKRQEMKDEQEKLNSSLNTPLCKSEEAVLLKKTWMSEIKDLNNSFGKIPPISSNSKVAGKGQSYFVDLN